MFRVLLAEVIARGVRLEAHEAVAIAQQLISRGAVAPSPHNVRVGADGSVECVGCDTTPAVYEMAIFLQALLPPGRVGVPGGVRYTIARALHEVDARPFDSIDDFSSALERFEKGDRRAVVGQLVRRAIPVAAAMPFGAHAAAAPTEHSPLDGSAVPDLPLAPDELSDALAPLEGATPITAGEPVASFHSAASDPKHADSWWGALAIAAALVVCALGGFATVRFVTKEVRGPQRHELTRAVAPPPAPQSAPREEAPAPALPSEPIPARAGTSPRHPQRRRAVVRTQANAEPTLVEALDAQRRPVFSPAFASNGSAIFFHTGGSHDARSAIAVSNGASGYDLQVMTIVDDGARNYHVQPSPDGRQIAFDSDRDGERGIYLAKRDGSDVRRITGPGYAAVPTWSPDGRRIAYIRAEAANPKVWNLWIQSLDDGRETRLTNYRYGQTWSASWFPDGRRICYSHEDTLVIVNLDTGREQVFDSPVKGRLVRTPAVSPDGTKIIFQVYRQGAWMMNVADGAMQFALTDPTAEEFAWAPDGRHVAFHSRRDGAWGIYVIAG